MLQPTRVTTKHKGTSNMNDKVDELWNSSITSLAKSIPDSVSLHQVVLGHSNSKPFRLRGHIKSTKFCWLDALHVTCHYADLSIVDQQYSPAFNLQQSDHKSTISLENLMILCSAFNLYMIIFALSTGVHCDKKDESRVINFGCWMSIHLSIIFLYV